MSTVKLALTALLALAAIAVPTYITAILTNWMLAIIVAICVALGIAGGRALAGGDTSQSTSSRAGRRQSKGARNGGDGP